MVQEAVEQLYAVAVVASDIFQLLRLVLVVLLERVKPLRFHPVAGDLIEDLDLVKGSDKVVTG